MFIRTRTRTSLGYGRRDRRDWPSSGAGKVTTYYQAIESYRDPDGRPRHRVLASWRNDPTVDAAIATCEASLATFRKYLDRDRSLIPEGHAGVRNPSPMSNGNWISREANDASIATYERLIAKEEARLTALGRVAVVTASASDSPPIENGQLEAKA